MLFATLCPCIALPPYSTSSGRLKHQLQACSKPGMCVGCWVCVLLFVAAGFFFGRTPLIKLSPKKTWEGFIGGFIGTVIVAALLADIMSRFKWMTCPRPVRRHLGAKVSLVV